MSSRLFEGGYGAHVEPTPLFLKMLADHMLGIIKIKAIKVSRAELIGRGLDYRGDGETVSITLPVTINGERTAMVTIPLLVVG